MTVAFYKDKWTEENLKKIGLNERQIKVVRYMKHKGSTSISDLRTIISDVTDKTIQRDLELLIKKKILISEGEKKGRKYKIID